MEEKNKYGPLVTVLMPCYNAMPYLNEALDSIMNQTYTNLEILCINDGSTDETGDVLEQYAKKDSRIRVIHNEKNLKLITTLNKGIQLAKGDYIARMDADDISSPNRIEQMKGFLKSENADVVSCKSIFISESGKYLGKNPLKCFNFDEIKFGSYFFTPILHPPLLGKREVFNTYFYSNNENSLHVEDYELWTRLLRKNVVLSNLDKALYSIRINQESVSRKYEKEQIENFIICANRHQEYFLNHDIPIEVTAIAVNRISNTSFKLARKGINLVDEIKKQFLTSTYQNSKNRKQIETISDIQKIDIAIQLIKKGRILTKFLGIYLSLTLSAKNLFNAKFNKYLFSKF